MAKKKTYKEEYAAYLKRVTALAAPRKKDAYDYKKHIGKPLDSFSGLCLVATNGKVAVCKSGAPTNGERPFLQHDQPVASLKITPELRAAVARAWAVSDAPGSDYAIPRYEVAWLSLGEYGLVIESFSAEGINATERIEVDYAQDPKAGDAILSQEGFESAGWSAKQLSTIIESPAERVSFYRRATSDTMDVVAYCGDIATIASGFTRDCKPKAWEPDAQEEQREQAA